MNAWFRIIFAFPILLSVSTVVWAQEAAWRRLNAIAEDLWKAGKYSESAEVGKKALEAAEKSFGPNHLRTATSLNSLAKSFVSQGKHSQAEPLLKRSLAIREKTLGPDHDDVAESLKNLVDVYIAQKKYSEAKPLLRRGLLLSTEKWAKGYPAGDPRVPDTLNSLAQLLERMGEKDVAAELEKRARKIKLRYQVFE